MRANSLLAIAAACVACVYLCAAGVASARHRSHPSAAAPGAPAPGASAPGAFAYYLLSLSWSPAFCLSSPKQAECNGPRRFGFIVHGLWPQNEQGWPEYCDVHRPVPDDVVQSVADVMPARGLVYHEWSAHGTCSGLEPREYFELVRRAYEGIIIPRELLRPVQPVEQSPAAITAAFLHANPRIPAQSVVITCSGQDVPRLREVHICLARDLAPRNCSAKVARAACGASEVIIPPIR